MREFKLQRLGIVMEPEPGNAQEVEGVLMDDKDASLFPVAIPNLFGQPELAMLHRPLFPGTRPEETARHAATRDVDLDRESIFGEGK